MNSLLRAALGALVHVLAPGAETSGDRAGSAAGSAAGAAAGTAERTAVADRTFAEQQCVAPAWEHGHVPMSVDLFGALGRILDARDTPQTPSAEQLSRIGRMGDDCSALSGRAPGQDKG
ncbi:hypothetical protein [Oerskovia jenensis]|uniref:hypothetical protein n=1 Tax=Oerskovia jenensis TaxID=162169 RepID=UPI0036D7F83E